MKFIRRVTIPRQAILCLCLGVSTVSAQTRNDRATPARAPQVPTLPAPTAAAPTAPAPTAAAPINAPVILAPRPLPATPSPGPLTPTVSTPTVSTTATPTAPAPIVIQPRLGDALRGLTFEQSVLFTDGQEEFSHVETIEGGLGPIFNDVSCVACHNAGSTGGAGRSTVTHFGRTTNGVFDPLESLGGSLLQARAINPGVRETIPAIANTVARRLTTALFGAGLIEAIPDNTIAAGLVRSKPRGIAGKVSILKDVVSGENRVGRFGWKSQQATLLAFAADAYRNEMGVTNRFFPTENAPNGNVALIARFMTTTGPEDAINPADGKADIDRAADYMRLLAPPPTKVLSVNAVAGQRLFTSLDCAACHTPQMTTGRNAIAALSEKTVNLYSDLLLHDMGTLGDGIAQGTAGPREMRTAPLWGLSARPLWLHDGRARSIDEAIRGHDGEARDSRDRYNQLNATSRRQLLDFLDSI